MLSLRVYERRIINGTLDKDYSFSTALSKLMEAFYDKTKYTSR